MASKILIFSNAMVADYSFCVKPIVICAPIFCGYIISVLAIVIACRLQRWAWSKANNLIFRCFQWEPIIIVVSRVPRLPTGPYRLIQTKCQKGHRPTTVHRGVFCQLPFRWIYYCYVVNRPERKLEKRTSVQCSFTSSKVFWSCSCPLMTYVNQNHGKIRMFWDDSNSWLEDSKGWRWFTQILTLIWHFKIMWFRNFKILWTLI